VTDDGFRPTTEYVPQVHRYREDSKGILSDDWRREVDDGQENRTGLLISTYATTAIRASSTSKTTLPLRRKQGNWGTGDGEEGAEGIGREGVIFN
jgi:hypothetical protein